jgi:perosamine synthetase
MEVGINLTHLEPEDIASVNDSLAHGWFSSAGPVVQEFEALWADYCQRSFGISVSNGTTALISATHALDLGPGDEVIIPNFTIISCALAVIMTGATPVLVDCEPETLNLDPAQVEARITPRTRAIMVVHMYGHPVNMEALQKIALKHSLQIIEDAAEAHGAEYLSDISDTNSWTRCGSESTISIFSFYANKNITTGEGGMALTNDPNLSKKLRDLRNLGFSSDRSYLHQDFGYQFRLSSMQAALAIPQIRRIEKILEKKKNIHDTYEVHLKDIHWLTTIKAKPWARPSYWVNPIILEPSWGDVNSIRSRLFKVGIETRPLFSGMHQQPIYKDHSFTKTWEFPNSEHASEYGLFLPSGVATSKEQVEYVCEEIAKLG